MAIDDPNLKKKAKFNPDSIVKLEQLRTEIWKQALLATDEHTLVQNLLDETGRVLACENVSFMPFDKELKEIVVRQQWRSDGEKEGGLGEVVPLWIFKRHIGKPYAQILFDELPRWLQPVLKIFEKKYGTRSTLVIPYGDIWDPDGFFSINHYLLPKKYSTKEIELFRELSQIIHLRSQQLKSEAALRESEARWEFALEGSGDGVWDWNAQTNEVFYSKQWKAMLGFAEDEISNILDEWEKRVHPDDLDYVLAEVGKHLNGNSPVYQSEHRVLHKDGHYIWILDRGKVISRTDEGKPLRVIGTHTDITQRKQVELELEKANQGLRKLQEKLREQAIKDPMTGLHNRRFMYEQFSHELARAKRGHYPFSVIMMDMDELKFLNDTYGHHIGDKALITLAECLKRFTRAEDIACRYGGDEFNIVMGRAEGQDALTRVEEWRQFLIKSPIEADDGTSIIVKFSAGIACYPAHGKTMEALNKNADAALYQAKETGRNRVCLASDL